MSAPGTVLIGGGVSAGTRAARRWRSARWPLLVVAVVLLTSLAAALLPAEVSQDPLAPDNPGRGGAQAAARILADQGVEVELVRSSAEALATAGAGSTLLVVGTYLLTAEQIEDLAATEADLVLASPEGYDLPALTDDALAGGSGSSGLTAARCQDPDALAAEKVDSRGFGVRATAPDAVVCFPSTADPTSGGYAVVQADGHRVTVLDDASLLSNERLDEDGAAALVLRSLGRHPHLVWYLPSFDEAAAGPATGDLLPGWATAVGLQLVVVVLALALWRGRALGPVVTEPLPVTVRAAETTLGRGRLYRRARSRGHAAASLRAGTARRGAVRLGLPRTAGAPAVIDALVRATGRPTEQVVDLLYGPPPTDDAGLVDLARLLDQLESEVHRP